MYILLCTGIFLFRRNEFDGSPPILGNNNKPNTFPSAYDIPKPALGHKTFTYVNCSTYIPEPQTRVSEARMTNRSPNQLPFLAGDLADDDTEAPDKKRRIKNKHRNGSRAAVETHRGHFGGTGGGGDRGLVISVALSLPSPLSPPLVPTPMVRSEHKTRATALWKYNIILIVSFNTFKSLLILSKSL